MTGLQKPKPFGHGVADAEDWILVGLIMFGQCAHKAWGGEASENVSLVAKQSHQAALPAAQPVLTINLALKDGKFYLGEVPVQIIGEEAVSIKRDSFLKAAAPVLKPEVADTIRNLPAEVDFVRLKRLKEAGLIISFDMEQMTLCVSPTVEQRPHGHVSLSADSDSGTPDRFSKQSAVSGYVNLNSASQYTGAASSGGKSGVSETLGTAAAVRVLDLVIENEATFSNGASIRQGTRAVYDLPGQALRFAAGDVTATAMGSQGGSTFFGFSVQKSYAKLQPQKNIRPTGDRSFRLERPSEVDIIVNGQLVRRLQMPPGDHDISELPLKPGQNVLKLEITDDTGQHRTLEFTVYFDHTFLSPGISEWGFAGGVTSTVGFNGVAYDWRNPAATAYYQTGLTENLTGTAHIQADSHAIMAGLMGVTQVPLGLVSFEAAGSERWDGALGAAAAVTYTPETLFKSSEIPGLAQIALNYRSAAFSPILATPAAAGVYSVNGFYSVPLPDAGTLALSASASVGEKPGFGAGFSFTRNVSPDFSWSISTSWDSVPETSGASGGPSWSAVARFALKLDKDTGVSYSLDKASGKAQAEVATQERTAEGSYSVKAQMENDPGATPGAAPDAQTNLTASYSGPRFDLGASLARQTVQGGPALSNVSVISGAAAIAFADDRIAVGRPVSDSFAIVAPHASLQDASIQVPASEKGVRAASSVFTDALVSDLPSYSSSQLPVQVDGAPDGYDLGSGLFEVRPSYKSGYVLQVGSDYSVTAIGTLENEGKPLALLSGLAKESGVADPKKVVVFTNGDGHFAAEGLKPGLWQVEILSAPPVCFALQIPDATAGLFDAGSLVDGARHDAGLGSLGDSGVQRYSSSRQLHWQDHGRQRAGVSDLQSLRRLECPAKPHTDGTEHRHSCLQLPDLHPYERLPIAVRAEALLHH